jgi:hypothetical protein
MMAKLFAPGTIAGRAFTGPSDLFHYDEMWNRRELHAAELPSSNGIGSARALARLYGSLVGPVDGIRTLRDETVERACEVQSDGPGGAESGSPDVRQSRAMSNRAFVAPIRALQDDRMTSGAGRSRVGDVRAVTRPRPRRTAQTSGRSSRRERRAFELRR